MATRGDASIVKGGDVVQMERTAVELRALGVTVDVSLGAIRDVHRCDVVHAFNTTRIDETYKACVAAVSNGKPFVVSTIWHSMEEMRRAYAHIYNFPWFPVWTYTAAKEWLYARRSGQKGGLVAALMYSPRLRYVLSKADAILPNSTAEAKAILRECGVRPRLIVPVPNGADIASAPGVPFEQRRDVICAGRVEPRKNQLKLVEAYALAGIPDAARLVFCGAIGNSTLYGKRFRMRVAAARAIYAGAVSQDELFARYRQARVAVLASFFETTGLVVIEALANGCAAVVTDCECTREYFGNAVEYCDPYSINSIAGAIERAWRRSPLQLDSLLGKYTWRSAACHTLSVYERVLRQRREGKCAA